MSFEFFSAPLREMAPEMIYGILRLRTDVFVVEQHCPYPELDGRDLEPGSIMVWAVEPGEPNPVGTLRILRDADQLRIGRVAAHPDERGTGLATAMFQFALHECARIAPDHAIVLDAQEPLEGWYEAFGFVRTGPTFLDDDIPHVPMRREPEVS